MNYGCIDTGAIHRGPLEAEVTRLTAALAAAEARAEKTEKERDEATRTVAAVNDVLVSGSRRDDNPTAARVYTHLTRLRDRAEKAERERDEARDEVLNRAENAGEEAEALTSRALSAEARVAELEGALETLAARWEAGWGAGQTAVAVAHREHAAALRALTSKERSR